MSLYPVAAMISEGKEPGGLMINNRYIEADSEAGAIAAYKEAVKTDHKDACILTEPETLPPINLDRLKCLAFFCEVLAEDDSFDWHGDLKEYIQKHKDILL